MCIDFVCMTWLDFNIIRHASPGTWQRFFLISFTLKFIFHISLLKLKNQYFHICSIHAWMSQPSNFSSDKLHLTRGLVGYVGRFGLPWYETNQRSDDIAGPEWTRNPHVYHAGWMCVDRKQLLHRIPVP